jgi:hypothetical protein
VESPFFNNGAPNLTILLYESSFDFYDGWEDFDLDLQGYLILYLDHDRLDWLQHVKK